MTIQVEPERRTPIPDRPIHVPAGEGRAFWGPGDRYSFLVTGEGSDSRCLIVDCLVPTGGGPPPHIHHREDEFFYLIEGELTVTVGGRTIEARTGDFVTAPRGVAHTFSNIGKGNAHMLAIFTPAGMEGWFVDALDPAGDKDGLAPPPTPELIARMLAAGSKHGVEGAERRPPRRCARRRRSPGRFHDGIA